MRISKLRLVFVAALVLVMAFGLAGQAFAAQPPFFEKELTTAGNKYVPQEIIVKFKYGVRKEAISNIISRHGTSVLYTSPYAGFMRLRVPEGRAVSEMVNIFSENPYVEYAEPNFIAHAFWSPDDEYYHYQWHLDNDEYGGINVEKAWDIETGDPGVIVAVIDTGAAYENYRQGWWNRYYLAPDLAETSFVAGYDFVNDDSHPNDDNSHGTHAAGTIAQSTNNGIGVAGVAFNCSIMPVKVLDRNGRGTYADVADGIRYAADHGADVINLSLGGSEPSTTLEQAVAYAYGKGVTVVCASGNDGAYTVSYPAAYDDYCIAVGATRYDEAVADYSNRGPSLDLVAPGGDLDVDQNNDGYGDGVLQQTFNPNTKRTNDFGYWFFEGTSCAAPHVSGVAALVIAHGITGPDNVTEALQLTAEDKGVSGWDPEYGWGIVDAYAALMWTAGPPNNPPLAYDQSVTTAEDTPVAITLTASDPDGDSLTFSVVNGPSKGSLSGTAPNLTYTPNLNFNGSDSFTFKAYDGDLYSDPATVSITVTAVNDAPVAHDQSVTTEEDTPVAITLTASDPDGDTLTFTVVSGPSNGTLSGTAPNLTYTPNSGFTGSDSFTFKAYDGQAYSDPATVSITVMPGTLSVEVVTDKSSYTRGETVNITVTVTRGASPVSGALVHVKVKDPRGRTAYQADGITEGGIANFQYKLSGWWARTGTYTVTATADTASDQTTFQVASSSGWGNW